MKTVDLGVEAAKPMRSGWSPAAEFGAAIAGLAVFVAFAMAVCSRRPPHADEVIDAELAINMVQLGKPVSYAFAYTTPGTLAVTAWPAYEYALAAWLSVWGVSRPAVLSFYITIAAIVSLLMLVVMRRTQLIESPRARILMSWAIPLLPAVASVYSKNRYDAMGMLGLAVATFALTVRRPSVHYGLIVVSGLAVGAGGFDVVIASGPLAMLLVLCTGRRFLAEVAVYLTCVAGGLGLTFGLMKVNGTFDDFLKLMRGSGVNASAAARGGSLGIRVVEPGLIAILVGTAVIETRRELMAAARRVLARTNAASGSILASLRTVREANLIESANDLRGTRHVTLVGKLVLLGLVAAVLVPTCISSVGHYNKEYRWLSAIPAFVAACIVAWRARSGWLRVAVAAALLPIVLSGLPARALVVGTEWVEQDYDPVQRFVAKHIAPDDIVFASWPLYYPAKRADVTAYFGGAFHRMTDAQRRAVTVAFFAGRDNGFGNTEPTIEEALRGFEERWTEVDRFVVPRGTMRSKLPPAPKSTYCYEVRVFRRINAEQSAAQRP